MKKLSVIIPAHNEEKTIKEVIRKVELVNLDGIEKEIILIDDKSTDRTREIIEQYVNKYKIVFLDKNCGKGRAVREGFKKATGDLAVIQDADLEYDPGDWPKLIKPILENEADAVFGSRFLDEIKLKNQIVYKRGYVFSRFLNWFSNFLSGLRLSDVYACYKVFSRDALDKILPRLVSNRFGIEVELVAYVAKDRLRVKEIPIAYLGRTYEEGKKINWKDGLAAVWHIIRFNIFNG